MIPNCIVAIYYRDASVQYSEKTPDTNSSKSYKMFYKSSQHSEKTSNVGVQFPKINDNESMSDSDSEKQSESKVKFDENTKENHCSSEHESIADRLKSIADRVKSITNAVFKGVKFVKFAGTAFVGVSTVGFVSFTFVESLSMTSQNSVFNVTNSTTRVTPPPFLTNATSTLIPTSTSAAILAGLHDSCNETNQCDPMYTCFNASETTIQCDSMHTCFNASSSARFCLVPMGSQGCSVPPDCAAFQAYCVNGYCKNVTTTPAP